MLKMSLSVFRRPDLTHDRFTAYWRDRHAPLVLRLAPRIGLKRYVQLHGRPGALARTFAADRGLAALHDGVAELWFESEAARLAAAMSDAGREASAMLRADEANFCDLARCTACFGIEQLVLAG